MARRERCRSGRCGRVVVRRVCVGKGRGGCDVVCLVRRLLSMLRVAMAG